MNGVRVLRATSPPARYRAPKVRAMEISDELEEGAARCIRGVAGYVDFSGNLDMAIALRTSVVKDGTAYIQAGGGIVADADSETNTSSASTRHGADQRVPGGRDNSALASLRTSYIPQNTCRPDEPILLGAKEAVWDSSDAISEC